MKNYSIVIMVDGERSDFHWEGLTPEDAQADLLANLDEDGFQHGDVLTCTELPS